MNFLIGPLRHWDSRRIDQEVEEELRFHLELLTEEHCRENIPWQEAQANAREQFGNVEQIRDECVRIARRNQPLVLALKWFLAFVFVTGVLVRIFGTDYHVTRVGDILMEVGALGRLLLYLRGKSPSKYLKAPQESELLQLNVSQISLATYDERGRTPVERVVSSR